MAFTMADLVERIAPTNGQLVPAYAGAGRGPSVATDRRGAPVPVPVVVVAVVALLLSVLTIPVTQLVQTAVSTSTSPSTSTSDSVLDSLRLPADLPSALEPVAAALSAPAAYLLSEGTDGWTAANPAHGFGIGFSADGPSVMAGGAALGLELSAVGRAGALAVPEAATLDADGALITYDRGAVTEWYVNDARGLEQGFTLAERPSGGSADPVVVQIAPTGGYTPTLSAGGGSITLTAGTSAFTYGGLLAVDADGDALPATLGVDGDRITLSVDDAGATYPIVVDPIVATQQRLLIETFQPAPANHYGTSVAVWGNTVAIGSPEAGGVSADAGRVHLYDWTGTQWTSTSVVEGDDPGDHAGTAVALSGASAATADTLAVAALGANGGNGSVIVFVKVGVQWVKQQTLDNPDANPADRFATSVALSDGILAVGAPKAERPNQDEAGAVFVFQRSGTTWGTPARLVDSTPEQFDDYGASVAMDGTTLVVGAPGDVTGTDPDGEHGPLYGPRGGSADVWTFDGSVWARQGDQLAASNGDVGNRYGSSVAISGDRIIVGAPVPSGQAYVLHRSGTTWSEEDIVTPPAGTADFGRAVALSGDVAFVSDPPSDNVHVVSRVGTDWVPQSVLTGVGGQDVALSGTTAAVGRPFESNENGSEAGSARIYTVANTAPTVGVEVVGQNPSQQNVATFRVTFSSPVDGFTLDDLQFDGTAYDTSWFRELTDPSGDRTTFVVQMDGIIPDGTIRLRIPAGVATDSAGLGNTGDPLGATFTLDRGDPALSMALHPSQVSPTSAATVRFRLTSTEDLQEPAASIPVLVAGTAHPTSAVVTPATPGNRREFDVAVTGMTDTGTVTARMNAGTVHDDAGNPASAAAIASVDWVDDNTAPTANITIGGAGFVREGDTRQLGGVTDLEGDASVTWTATRVSGPDAGATCSLSDLHALTPTVSCNNDGEYSISVSVDDGVNPVATDTVPMSVFNHEPDIGELTAPANVPPGVELEISAPVSDLGVRDVLTCTATWDDGTTSTGTISGGVCRARHTYPVDGFHSVRLQVADDTGATAYTPTELVRVAQAAQVIDFPAPTTPRVYGAAPFTVSATSSGASGLPITFTVTPGGACTISGTTVTIVQSGNCDITAHQAGNAQYTAAEDVFRRVVVTRAPITVTASAATMVYGDPAPTVTPSYSGFVNGDDVSDLTEGAFCTVFGASSTDVGVYPGATTCQNVQSPKYTADYVGGTLTVTPAPLTVTAPSPTKVYGDGISSFFLQPTYSGFKNNEFEGYLDVEPTCGGDSPTVAAGVHPGAITCAGAESGNYSFTYVPGTLTVTKRPVAVQATNATAVYGTPGAVFASFNGFRNGDTSAVLTTPATCTSGPVTQGVGVHNGATSCSGAEAANYTFTYSPGDLTVTKAPLTITASDATTTYGTLATITPSYSGLVNGDEAADLTTAPTCSGGSTSAGAGEYPDAATCVGAASPNYSFTYVTGDITVTKAPLTVTASDGSKAFGAPAIAVAPIYNGFVNGQNQTSLPTRPTCGGGSESTPTGTHPGLLTCSGGVSGNYEFTYVAGTLTVTQAVLTITASSTFMTYGGDAPPVTPVYSGFLNGDDPSDLTTLPTCIGGGPTWNAGSHTAGNSCSGAADETYTFNYQFGTLTVAKAQLFVLPGFIQMTYGDTPPEITPSYEGFVNDQDASVLLTLPTCGGASATTPVGNHGDLQCSGGSADNYSLVYAFGGFSVLPAPLVVTASSGTTTYGTAPTVTPSYAGFKNGETAAVLTTAPTCGHDAIAGIGATRTWCFNGVAANYSLDYVDGGLTITKAPLTITAGDATRVYGGANPTVTPGYSGFISGEDATALTTLPTCSGGTPSTPAGVHPDLTTCSGAVGANYAISYAEGDLTVTKAPLTITASDATMPYGADGATVTPQYSGFVNDQDASALTTAPTCGGGSSTTPFGTYPGGTTCSGAAAANYEIGYVAGTLTVNKAPLIIRATDTSMTYGASAPEVTPEYEGFVLGDDPSVLLALPTCSTTGTPTTAAGVHAGANTCSGAAATDRYEISYATGDLTVAKAPLVITASGGSMTYGGTPPTIIPAYDGFVNGEDASELTVAPTCVGGGRSTPAGDHPGGTSCSDAEAANYAITYVAGDLVVAKAPLAVTASDGTMVYGEAGALVTPSYDGFVNWDDASDLAAAPTCAGGSPTTPAGSYPDATACWGASAANYEISYATGDLTVDRAPLTITASDATMTYGGPPPAITPTYSGFVGDEGPAVLTTPPTCGGPTPTTHAGNHAGATSCSGAEAANYEIDYVAGDLTVGKATLTVTALDVTKPFGDAVPTLTSALSGFVNGEDASVVSGAPTLATTATATSSVGTYPITIGEGTLVAADYAFDLVPGVLTVTRATTALEMPPLLIQIKGLQTHTRLTARLTRGAANVPLEGKLVTFTAGTTTLCSGTTDADGTARCQVTVPNGLVAILRLGYTATYGGDADLAPATANAALVG